MQHTVASMRDFIIREDSVGQVMYIVEIGEVLGYYAKYKGGP